MNFNLIILINDFNVTNTGCRIILYCSIFVSHFGALMLLVRLFEGHLACSIRSYRFTFDGTGVTCCNSDMSSCFIIVS